MQNPSSDIAAIEAHYGHGDLETALLSALVAAGKDPDQLRPEDLAPVDEFHIGGRKATQELARKLVLTPQMQVLDLGCGIGGASRHLARAYGCRVTGLDLSQEYCRAAEMLTRRLGLGGSVGFRQGNALHMPFADGSFDLVWTQHASMNIADKAGLYREILRVLRPGGHLALYDVLAGPGGDVHFPVPWARESSCSHLIPPGKLRATLEELGFEILCWRDVTETGREWFRRLGQNLAKDGPPPLGIHVLLGPDFRVMAKNQVRNLEEDRIALIETVVRKPV